MTTNEFIEKLAGMHPEAKKSELRKIVSDTLDLIDETVVLEGRIQIFRRSYFLRVRAPRAGFNPRTREKIEVPETRTIMYRRRCCGQ